MNGMWLNDFLCYGKGIGVDNLLEQFVENASDVILIADREGIIRFWNSGAERIFGYSPSEALGQSLDIIIPEKLRGRHWEGYSRVMETGETKYKTGLLSSPGMGKDGKQVSLEFSMALLKNGNGIMQGCGSIMRDVTERRQKEMELKQRLSQYESKL